MATLSCTVSDTGIRVGTLPTVWRNFANCCWTSLPHLDDARQLGQQKAPSSGVLTPRNSDRTENKIAAGRALTTDQSDPLRPAHSPSLQLVVVPRSQSQLSADRIAGGRTSFEPCHRNADGKSRNWNSSSIRTGALPDGSEVDQIMLFESRSDLISRQLAISVTQVVCQSRQKPVATKRVVKADMERQLVSNHASRAA